MRIAGPFEFSCRQRPSPRQTKVLLVVSSKPTALPSVTVDKSTAWSNRQDGFHSPVSALAPVDSRQSRRTPGAGGAPRPVVPCDQPTASPPAYAAAPLSTGANHEPSRSDAKPSQRTSRPSKTSGWHGQLVVRVAKRCEVSLRRLLSVAELICRLYASFATLAPMRLPLRH